MEGRLLLDVVVAQGSSVLELFTGEDESLLIWWDTFLILDLGLDVLDSVSWLDIEGDGLTSESLDEDLHTSSESKNQVKSGFFLDIVVAESSSIFKLLSSENKSLLVRWDTFLVLDLSFNVLDGVSWLNIKGDSLTSEGLDEDLHTSSKSENEMESGLLLDVVVGEGSAVLELLTSEDESLLIWWDTLLVLDLSLNIFNGVSWLNVQGNSFSCECLNENLHLVSFCLL